MADNINHKIKNLVDNLKSDSRFKILEDGQAHGFGDGVDYWVFTILKSKNLDICYGQEMICGAVRTDEISVFNQRDNCAYSNSAYAYVIYKDKRRFLLPPIKDLKEYIENNV